MNTSLKASTLLLCLSICITASTQNILTNPYSRNNSELLNGKWNALIDVFCMGESNGIFKNRPQPITGKPQEYTFNDGFRLDVPGDFNSQLPELMYYEGNVWYQRKITVRKTADCKQFLYFAGANYITKVWLNGVFIGEHEGGFLPFQFDITKQAQAGENNLVVLTNNNRRVDYIPAMNFDWWNYGGITRDVFLIETPRVYINDYTVQLKKGTKNIIAGTVKLEGSTAQQQIEILIPELKIRKKLFTDSTGFASFEITAKPQLWEPASPKLYDVKFITDKDTVFEQIGFRTIETKGTNILLNGKPIFLKGVNSHEEIPQRMGRAYSDADAAVILSEAKALGCNFIRTAHYAQNERIVRMAEKMGLMIWEEIPVWQGIKFTDEIVMVKAQNMLREMILRDKNRAAIIIWSIQNETQPTAARDKMLIGLAKMTQELDNTRLIAGAFNNVKYNKTNNTFTLSDSLINYLDIIGINKYMGWYDSFQVAPGETKWDVAAGKPLIMSEYGGEALYGQHGNANSPASWSEEMQEKLYRDNLTMFNNISNLCGTVPWVLFDFRSPNRWHKQNQDGWNRKGLISDKGQRKKAWYVMKEYYERK
jgi:beta-glucuronidase